MVSALPPLSKGVKLHAFAAHLVPFQVEPEAQEAEAVLKSSKVPPEVFRVKLMPVGATTAVTPLPVSPLPTMLLFPSSTITPRA